MRITTEARLKKSRSSQTQHPTHAPRELPRRVLHAVGQMNCGGIETWLMHLLRTIDRKKIAMDFLVHTLEPGFYDEELLDHGARIVFAGSQYTPATLTRNFGRALTKHGPYHAFHSHVGHFSGYLMSLSRLHGIKTRIAHSHNDWKRAESSASIPRRAYLTAMSSQIRLNATHGIAPSNEAASSLFGNNWQRDPRFHVMHYGLDFTPFSSPINRHEIRKSFGFTPENYVFAHVGSFSTQKNHDFLLLLMQQIAKHSPECRLLLLGDGPLRPHIQQKIDALKLSKSVVLAGVRSDIPQILRSMDAFIFPSLFEGLGIALVEAQAAGLPCIISNSIPGEAIILPELVDALDLNQHTLQQWTNACISALHRPKIAQKLALSTVQESDFNIARSSQLLHSLY